MKEEGIVDAVGLAAGNVDVMTPLLRDWDFDALITHNRFTLANRNAEPMIDFAVGKGIAVLNAAPYAGGVLAKGSAAQARYVYQQATAAMLDPIRRIEAVCARHAIPTGAAALQFSLRDPRVTATICGVTRRERVQQTLDWANWPIGDDCGRSWRRCPTSAPTRRRRATTRPDDIRRGWRRRAQHFFIVTAPADTPSVSTATSSG